MRIRTALFPGLICALTTQAQWIFTPLAPLPLPTANHAICAAAVNGNTNVYVFGGITTGLGNANIHREAFRYDVATNVWTALPDVPDSLGKVAAAASVVGDTAYVIGGYHVFNGAPFELSSNRVHRLDLSTDSWMSDGAAVPVPIDDQVQAVWRDSLIYVITGWSNTTNVPNVQVYDPAQNTWSAATPVPNNNQYKAFGASGLIIGDTIYYHGGASTGNNFPAQDRLRIGVIDPLAPTSITWLPTIAGTLGARYRSGAIAVEGKPTWIGGSAVSYNYNAVAYNGSGVVSPVTEVHQWSGGAWVNAGSIPAEVMDLRGVGELGDGSFLVAGGIGAQQLVLDSVWRVSYLPTSIVELNVLNIGLHPVPATDHFTLSLPNELSQGTITIRDALGRTVHQQQADGATTRVDLEQLAPGIFTVQVLAGRYAGVARLLHQTP